MTTEDAAIAALLEDAALTLEDLCRAGRVTPQWVAERVEAGLLGGATAGAWEQWRFDSLTLRRVLRMVQLEREFDAVPELAALVADLQAEIERLRRRLRRAGLDQGSVD
jgi:chaperone modulatory protein CbpM